MASLATPIEPVAVSLSRRSFPGLLFHLLGSSICGEPSTPVQSSEVTRDWRASTEVVYMGKDKYENEELLKYGFPEEPATCPHGGSPTHVD